MWKEESGFSYLQTIQQLHFAVLFDHMGCPEYGTLFECLLCWLQEINSSHDNFMYHKFFVESDLIASPWFRNLRKKRKKQGKDKITS
jgi:hypothetical protein